MPLIRRPLVVLSASSLLSNTSKFEKARRVSAISAAPGYCTCATVRSLSLSRASCASFAPRLGNLLRCRFAAAVRWLPLPSAGAVVLLLLLFLSLFLLLLLLFVTSPCLLEVVCADETSYLSRRVEGYGNTGAVVLPYGARHSPAVAV